MPARPLEKPIAKRRVARALVEGVPQTEIATALGVTQSAIAKWRKRHMDELAGIYEDEESYTTRLILRDKARRQATLHAMVDVVSEQVLERGGFKSIEPKQLKDEVVMVERTDGVLLNGLRGLLDDIAAEEGARTRGPVISVTNQVLIRAYDIGTDPSTV
jgi:transposase-like protein